MVPNPTLVWRQRDAAATICGVTAACSGASTAGQVVRAATKGGVPGSLHSAMVAKNSTRAAFVWECPVPSKYQWNAGDWWVEVNVTNEVAGTICTLDAVYICRTGSGCVNKGTIASQTDIGQDWVPGIYKYDFAGVGVVAHDVGDHVTVVVVLKNASAFLGVFPECRFDREIKSPFVVPALVGPPNYKTEKPAKAA